MGHNLIPIHLSDKDILSMSIVAKEITTQSGYVRGNNTPIGTSKINDWLFLAPNEISENVVHTWEEYESIATRLAQQAANLYKVSKIGDQAVRSAEDKISRALEGIPEGQQTIDSRSGLLRGAQEIGEINLVDSMGWRVDSPLVYRDSNRREYTFTFSLAHYDNNTTAEDIFKAIRELQELSCPEMEEDSAILIKFPACFEIKTEPLPFIHIEYAALTAVQPTWKSPYRNGYPIHTDLTLTFKDIAPLYRDSFGEGSLVRVGG